MADLWPEDLTDITGIKTPVTVLKEQAKVLGDRTKNVLEGRVRQSSGDDNKLCYDFAIFAPLLDYTYSLFYMNHGVELYPLVLGGEDLEIRQKYRGQALNPHLVTLTELTLGEESASFLVKINDEDNLVALLRDLFSSTRTKNIIRSLIVQSKEQKPSKPRRPTD